MPGEKTIVLTAAPYVSRGRHTGYVYPTADRGWSTLVSTRVALKQKNCVVLDGRFSWTAAASVVHRVCRIGRESKTAYGKQVLGRQGDLSAVNTSSDTAESGKRRRKRTKGVAGGSRSSPAATSSPTPHRPPPKRGNPTPRRKGRGDSSRVSANDRGGTTESTRLRRVNRDRSSGTPTETKTIDESTVTAGERQEGDGQRQPWRDEQETGGQGNQQAKEEDGETEETTTTPLSKEAAFLKVAEVTEGGQGAMLFSEFVEALTRLCLKRYGARAAPRAGGPAPPPSTTSRMGGFGVGLRKTNIALKFSANSARSISPGRSQNVRGPTQQQLG